MRTENPRDIDRVARISTGDATALARVYDRHSAAAYRLAYHILRDAEAATAVVEEVFLSLWRQPPTGQAAQGLKPWVVGRVCVQATARPRGAHEVVLCAARAADEASQTREGRSLDAALTRLPDIQQRALLLAYVGGVTHEEIACSLAVSDVAVRRALQRALQALHNA